MSYITHLDLAVNHSLQGQRWSALAGEIGAPFQEYDGPYNLGAEIEFIRGATGLVLPWEPFLHTPKLVDAIREAVAAGRPLLVWVDPNSLDRLTRIIHEQLRARLPDWRRSRTSALQFMNNPG